MKIFVGICQSQEWVRAQFFWSMVNVIGQAGYPLGIYQTDAPWDDIRNNTLIDGFLKSDCDIFAKCDSDQIYPDDYIKIMVPLVEKYKVIGPVIFDRGVDSNHMTLCFEDKNNILGTQIDLLDTSGIAEFPYTHTNNFYAREVLEKLDPPWYSTELSADGLQRTRHMDYDFLDKVKDAGYPIYTNCDVVVEHIVPLPLSRDLVRRLRC